MSTSEPGPPAPYFPLLRFSSLLGVHTTLLLFTALYLPRSTFLISSVPPQASSRDRPEHAFLRALTADATLTLTWLCLGAAFVQGSWASWIKIETDLARMEIFGDGEEARVRRAMESGKDKFQSMKDAIISTLACSIFIHAILILFGAPLIAYFLKTFLLATLLSLLIVYPSVYTLRSPSLTSNVMLHRMMWLRLFVELSPRTAHERLLVYPTIGTVLGAWVGAFPIALDWDRPWQAWPLTPAYGAIAGYIIGSWAALAYTGFLYLVEAGKEAEAEKRAEANAAAAVSKKKGSMKKTNKAGK